MNLPTLTQIGKGSAGFLRYQEGELWYLLWYKAPCAEGGEELLSFEFPIPIGDAGGGAFLERMSGLSILRWARRHVEYIRQALEAAEEQRL